MARHDSNTIIKFADDTTVVGLITDNDETAYRVEVRDLAGWCQNSNLSHNGTRTEEMIVNYRKRRTEHSPILIDRAVVEQLQAPWCPHQQQTRLVQTNQDSRKEGTTKPIPSMINANSTITPGETKPQLISEEHFLPVLSGPATVGLCP
jgi:hypothetical protein